MKLTGKAAVLLISASVSFALVHWFRGGDDSLSPEGQFVRRPAPGSMLQFEALKDALERARREKALEWQFPAFPKTAVHPEGSAVDETKALAESPSGITDDGDEAEKRLRANASKLSLADIELFGRWLRDPRSTLVDKVAAALVLWKNQSHEAIRELKSSVALPKAAPGGPIAGGPTTPTHGLPTHGAPIVGRAILDSVVQSQGSSPETAHWLEQAESEPSMKPVRGYIQQLKAAVASGDVKGHYERQDQMLRQLAGAAPASTNP